MARAKQRKTAVTHPAAADKPDGIPAPFPVPDIAGPSAQELAAHDSAFLTQAILVQQKGDTPALPIHDDVMTADAFAMREIMLGLSFLGVGEIYATRIRRLAGVVQALEQRVFSEAFLAHLSLAARMEMYQGAVSESDKSAKSLAAVVASVDLDTIRPRFMALRVPPEAPPGAGRAQFAQRGHKKRPRGNRRPPAAAVPGAAIPARPPATTLRHEAHLAGGGDDRTVSFGSLRRGADAPTRPAQIPDVG